MNPAADKTRFRREVFSQLRGLTDRPAKSQLLCERLVQHPRFAAAKSVLLYSHIRTEVQTTFAIEQTLQAGKRLILPRCEGNDLVLYEVERLDELATGSFGISEPSGSNARNLPLNVAEIDLLCIPGVAFDQQGRRLGRGRGFYDRLLADAAINATIWGLAFECQVIDRVPSESHDRPMHGVVTESRMIDSTHS